ncbi:uncharacterized protein LOC112018342 [Quercus suber]|uniref:Uncharacterized protein n=1 Tax=Quercus suber TaxID=58331 RepID=A0AAW0KNH1_QUESU
MDRQNANETLFSPPSVPSPKKLIFKDPPAVQAKDDVVGEDTGPLFLLRKFPNNSPNSSNFNELSPDSSELYASTALSVKKLIVSELSSSRENVNVETMVELANKAFETLDWLGADYADLYDAVRALLSHCAQLSSAKSELQTHQNEESNAISYLDVLQRRCTEAFEAFAGSLAEYLEAEKRLGVLNTSVSEQREVLRKLKKESAQKGKEVAVLKGKWKRCLRSHLVIKNEKNEFAEQVTKKRKIVQMIEGRCDEIKAGVKRCKETLSSLY